MNTTTNTSAAPATSATRAKPRVGTGPAISLQNVACDGCPTARAKARIVLEKGELYLCGHHLRENLEKLSETALSITSDDPKGSYWMPEAQR